VWKKIICSFDIILFCILVVFMALKLTRLVAWSWAWVLTPLWVPAVIFALGCIVAVFVTMNLRKDFDELKRILKEKRDEAAEQD